jgi:hypothetical protein
MFLADDPVGLTSQEFECHNLACGKFEVHTSHRQLPRMLARRQSFRPSMSSLSGCPVVAKHVILASISAMSNGLRIELVLASHWALLDKIAVASESDLIVCANCTQNVAFRS